MPPPRRLRTLACAFACCPPGKPGFSGGEDVLGWNLVHQIGRYRDVWVLTHGKHQSSIEEALAEHPEPTLHFLYVNLPKPLQGLLKIQGGIQFYYWVWQVKA